jgi:hypothetical protein
VLRVVGSEMTLAQLRPALSQCYTDSETQAIASCLVGKHRVDLGTTLSSSALRHGADSEAALAVA